MKTFTVCFGPLHGLCGVDGVLIAPGIAVARGGKFKDHYQVNLGEYGPGGRWTNVQLSTTMPPRVIDGKLVEEAGVFKARNGKHYHPILDKPPVGDDHAILVRVNTKTQLDFGLVFTAVGCGSRIVAEGSSYNSATGIVSDDMLVTIEPHQAVVIGQPEDKEKFIVVNNGGVADVVTVDDYQAFFAPHVLAKDLSQETEQVPA